MIQARRNVLLPQIEDPEKASQLLAPSFVDQFREKLENHEFDPDPALDLDWGSGGNANKKGKGKGNSQEPSKPQSMMETVKTALLNKLENQMKRELSHLEDQKYRPPTKNTE